MAMARAAGAVGVLVLTGEATREQAEEVSPAPDLVLNDIGELGALLTASLGGTGIPACGVQTDKNVCAPGVKP
jgi:hypothetical protein